MYVLGTVLVVATHCGNGGLELLDNWFAPYSFHLAIFMFVSGYFYKSEVEAQPGKYLFKKVKTLLVPLYIWNLCYAVLVWLLSHKGFTIGGPVSLYSLIVAPVTNGHQFVYNMGGWFVIPLFMVQVGNMLLRKAVGRLFPRCREWLWFLLYFLMGMAGISLAASGYRTGWWLVLVRMLYFLPFYSLGTLYRRKLEQYDRRIPGLLYFSIILLCQLVILYFYRKPPNYIPSWCNTFTDGPFMPFVAGILGLAFWLRICKILEPAIGKNKYIHLIADNTYAIMIHQFLGFMAVKTVFALFSKFTPFFGDFDMGSYKGEIWYYYLPGGLEQMHILYFVAGIALPILIQLTVNKVQNRVKENLWCKPAAKP